MRTVPVVLTFAASKDDYKRLVDVFGTEQIIGDVDELVDDESILEPEARLSSSGEIRGQSGFYRVRLTIEHYNGMEALRKLGLLT